MEVIAHLGTLLGLSFVSGINLYATVAVVGLSIKYHLVQSLPGDLYVLANNAVIAVAVLLYLVEFLIDKVPGLDTLWDALHTFIRPLGGALLALMQLGEASPALQVIVFMLGASLASVAHFTKAGTRLLINTSPEPISNMVVSVGEDLGVIGFSYLSLTHPKWSFFLTLVFLTGAVFLAPMIFRAVLMLLTALGAKIAGWLRAGSTVRAPAVLPIRYDLFFEDKKEKGEKIRLAMKCFAGRIPNVPRCLGIHLVLTDRALYVLHRKRFRLHLKRLLISDIHSARIYPGRFLYKWLVRTPEETWLIYLTTQQAKTLPGDLTTSIEVE